MCTNLHVCIDMFKNVSYQSVIGRRIFCECINWILDYINMACNTRLPHFASDEKRAVAEGWEAGTGMKLAMPLAKLEFDYRCIKVERGWGGKVLATSPLISSYYVPAQESFRLAGKALSNAVHAYCILSVRGQILLCARFSIYCAKLSS